jgi:uncharacterized membrane protein YgcG
MASVREAHATIAALHNTCLPGAAGPLVVRFADSAEQKAKKAARMSRALDRWATISGGGTHASGSGDWPGGGGGSGGGGSVSSDFGRVSEPPVRERESSIYIKYLPPTVGSPE